MRVHSCGDFFIFNRPYHDSFLAPILPFPPKGEGTYRCSKKTIVNN